MTVPDYTILPVDPPGSKWNGDPGYKNPRLDRERSFGPTEPTGVPHVPYPGSGPSLVADPSGDGIDFYAMARALFPGYPEGFINAFAEGWMVWADLPNVHQLALGAARQDESYDTWFPGIKRDDGSFRMSETEYLTNMDAFEAAVNQVTQLSPGIFTRDQYVSLIAGEVSPIEFARRLQVQTNEVLSRSEGFREYYAGLYGIFDLSDGQILESALTGNADALLRQAITATVGFEGERRGFTTPLTMASSLYDAGVTSQAQASELFGQAASSVPLFGQLAERHFDPDDTFDVGEFIEAAVFDDQDQMNRMRRLISQERSLFTNYRPLRERRETGEIVGLLPR